MTYSRDSSCSLDNEDTITLLKKEKFWVRDVSKAFNDVQRVIDGREC